MLSILGAEILQAGAAHSWLQLAVQRETVPWISSQSLLGLGVQIAPSSSWHRAAMYIFGSSHSEGAEQKACLQALPCFQDVQPPVCKSPGDGEWGDGKSKHGKIAAQI